MRELMNRVFTNARWFLGFVIVLLIFILFVWRLADKEGFIDSIQGFMNDVWEIAKMLLTLAIMIAGLRMMFGWRPFGKKKSGH